MFKILTVRPTIRYSLVCSISKRLPSNNIFSLMCFSQEKNVKQMSFQQLLEKCTDQSLTLAAEMLAKLQIKNQEQQSQLKQLQQRISEFPKNLVGLLQKQRKLMENIQLQRQDNNLIERRVNKQIQDCKNYGVSKVAKEVLQVADSLKKSKQLANTIYKQQSHSFIQQLRKTQATLLSIFFKYQIQQFDPIGMPYDPNTQQTVFQVKSQHGQKINTVAQTIRTGYKIKGRLLRSARVGIYN